MKGVVTEFQMLALRITGKSRKKFKDGNDSHC